MHMSINNSYRSIYKHCETSYSTHGRYADFEAFCKDLMLYDLFSKYELADIKLMYHLSQHLIDGMHIKESEDIWKKIMHRVNQKRNEGSKS